MDQDQVQILAIQSAEDPFYRGFGLRVALLRRVDFAGDVEFFSGDLGLC